MPSYFKNYWLHLIVAAVNFILLIITLFQPAPDTTTIEGINQNTEILCDVLIHTTLMFVWLLTSVINYNRDCIEALEKRVIKLEENEQ